MRGAPEQRIPADDGTIDPVHDYRGVDGILAGDVTGSDPNGTDLVPMGSDPRPTVDDYAGDVIDLLDTLHVHEAVVVGLSMGGYVAFAILRLAARRDDVDVAVRARHHAGNRTAAATETQHPFHHGR